MVQIAGWLENAVETKSSINGIWLPSIKVIGHVEKAKLLFG